MVTVHPRACGEQGGRDPLRHQCTGSSPRVRGTGRRGSQSPDGRRFIPARAGNSPSWRRKWLGRPVHPRACGEQVDFADDTDLAYGSSPRVRGTVGFGNRCIRCDRFIPARAGNSVEL